jgi:hypothetical protein
MLHYNVSYFHIILSSLEFKRNNLLKKIIRYIAIRACLVKNMLISSHNVQQK